MTITVSRFFKQPPFLLPLILLLTLSACGGGSGGSDDDSNDIQEPRIDESTDTDGDGFINLDDVDDDNDGLIEIKSLEHLDWIRNDMLGTSLTDHAANVMTDGCPPVGCSGYELAYSLDFDTNGDGLMNASDRYFDYHQNGTFNGWLPIGDPGNEFKSTFDGNGRTIRNLYLNRPASDPFTSGEYLGLFGVTSAFTTSANMPELRNLNLNGPLTEVTGQRYVGVLAGAVFWFYELKNIKVTATLNASGDSGLLVGRIVKSVVVDQCSSAGTVNSSSSGGLMGSVADVVTVSNSSSSATVNGFQRSGGLIGSANNRVTLTGNQASGNVTGTGNLGGLVGVVKHEVNITTSNASGAVTGSPSQEYVGGLIGLATGPNDAIPGLLPGTVTIVDSYATGDVIGGNFTGGLVGGFNFDNPNNYDCLTPCGITRSFATGSVQGNNYVGGLTGISFNLIVEDSFASGAVSNSNQYVGGLIGDANAGTVVNRSFSANPVSGNLDVGALVGFSDNASYADSFFSDDRGQANALGTNFSDPGIVNPAGTTGAPINDLKSVTTAGQNINGTNLFTNFGVDWDFGNSNQLPGLIIDSVIYRDGDANGTLD